MQGHHLRGLLNCHPFIRTATPLLLLACSCNTLLPSLGNPSPVGWLQISTQIDALSGHAKEHVGTVKQRDASLPQHFKHDVFHALARVPPHCTMQRGKMSENEAVKFQVDLRIYAGRRKKQVTLVRCACSTESTSRCTSFERSN